MPFHKDGIEFLNPYKSQVSRSFARLATGGNVKKGSPKKKNLHKEQDTAPPLPESRKIYEELNSKSFSYNFNILIRHYKSDEDSLPAKSS